MSMLMIIVATIAAIIFGQFAVLTEELTRDVNEYVDKMSLVNETINWLKLPKEMIEDVRNHILTTHSLKRL